MDICSPKFSSHTGVAELNSRTAAGQGDRLLVGGERASM